MTLLRHLRVAAFALLASGCVLLVSPFEVGEHCTIAGDSACATCIRTKCQPAVDGCCASTSCAKRPTDTGLFELETEDILDAIDACGRGDKNRCISELSTPKLDAEEETLRACVTSTCNAECVEGGTISNPSGKRPTWTCALPRTSEKLCGKCLFANCAAQLDECCADSSCSKDSELKEDIGACIAGDEPGCAYLRKQSTTGIAGTVRQCITDACGEECFGDGRLYGSCELYSGGAYCSCSDAESPSGPECSAAKVGGSCVIGKNGCTCGTYSCSSTSDGCACDFGSDDGGGSSCSVPSGEGVCCLSLDDRGVSCECSSLSKCYGDEYDVQTCNQSDVLAALRGAGRVVTSCTVGSSP